MQKNTFNPDLQNNFFKVTRDEEGNAIFPKTFGPKRIQENKIKDLKGIRKRAVSYPELYSQDLQWTKKQIIEEALKKKLIQRIDHYGSDGLVNDNETFETILKSGKAKPLPGDHIYCCSKSVRIGSTTKNRYYKLITCGKEWCKDCGSLHSESHDRRVDRLEERFINYLQDVGTIQYLVITVPFELRELFRSKKVLNDFRTYCRRKLKNDGKKAGLTRYHWAGEDGNTWKPHLNILTEGGFIMRSELEIWRNDLSQWFKDYFKLSYKPISNIYTGYTDSENKLKHWVSYVLRATQTIYNEKNITTITGYRNTAPFGKLPEKTTIAGQSMEIDPITGEEEPIIWAMTWNNNKNRMVPQLVSIKHIFEEKAENVGKCMWKKPKIPYPENLK
jgi:hypothetical protein